MHSNSSTNDAFLFAPVDGIYEVSAHVQWGPVGFLSPRTYIELDRGTTTTSIARSEESDTRALSVSTMVKLNAGQSVVVVVFQGTSNTQSIAKISEASPEFSMTWLAPGP